MYGPIEPSADVRVMAKTIHDCFLALCGEGFSEPQALVVIGQLIASNTQSRD